MAILGLYAAAAWYLRPWDAISPWRYYSIRLGMSEREADAVMGLPPGHHQSFRWIGGIISGEMVAQAGLSEDELQDGVPNGRPYVASDGRMVRVKQWWGDRYAIRVAIDPSGSVVGRYLIEVDHIYLDKLRQASVRPPG